MRTDSHQRRESHVSLPCQQDAAQHRAGGDNDPPDGGYKGSTMNRLFAALTVLTLLLGTVSFAAPASAGPANQFPPASNEGGGNN